MRSHPPPIPQGTSVKVGSVLSTEMIASSSPATGAAESCAACGAPLAVDQRYCLECGERRTPMSSVLLGGPPRGDSPPPSPATVPPVPGSPAAAQRSNTVSALAGVGVLLLAMGVGVLIGHSANSKPATPPVQVISVAQPGAAVGTTSTPSTPAPAPEGSTKSHSSSKQGSKQSSKQSSSHGSGSSSSSGNHAAPPVIQNLRSGKGQSYEQKSKSLPNVVSTG